MCIGAACGRTTCRTASLKGSRYVSAVTLDFIYFRDHNEITWVEKLLIQFENKESVHQHLAIGGDDGHVIFRSR
jgi:hypothetical protein